MGIPVRTALAAGVKHPRGTLPLDTVLKLPGGVKRLHLNAGVDVGGLKAQDHNVRSVGESGARRPLHEGNHGRVITHPHGQRRQHWHMYCTDRACGVIHQ